MAKIQSQPDGNASQHERGDEEHMKISTARINIVLFMTLFIDLLGFTVILPLMPKLLEFYGSDGSVSSVDFIYY